MERRVLSPHGNGNNFIRKVRICNDKIDRADNNAEICSFDNEHIIIVKRPVKGERFQGELFR